MAPTFFRSLLLLVLCGVSSVLAKSVYHPGHSLDAPATPKAMKYWRHSPFARVENNVEHTENMHARRTHPCTTR